MYNFIPNRKRFPHRFDQETGGAYQIRMREQFIAQAQDVLKRCSPRDTNRFQVGFETEFSVVDAELKPADQSLRDLAVQTFDFVGIELGASQIEIATKPVDIRNQSGLKALEELKRCESLLAAWLRQRGGYLLRLGAHPLVLIREIVKTQGVPKYRHCPDFHNQHQRRGMDHYIGNSHSINVGEATIPSITNSVQMNLDCHSLEEGIAILNRSLEVSPVATLLGVNAGFIDCQDSGYADLRYIAWRTSHDIRSWDEWSAGFDTRVGIPSRYYEDHNDYLSSVLSHPFFMEDLGHAFPMGVGTYWRDARLKFLEKPDGVQLVVELRPLSTQPSAEDDFCLLMFYLGRVFQAYETRENQLPLLFVQANKEQVMRLGRQAELTFLGDRGQLISLGYNEFMPIEISKSLEGLSRLGLDQETILLVRERLKERFHGPLPVDHFRTLVENELEKGAKIITALTKAIYETNLISN